jgi:hypothetical protein
VSNILGKLGVQSRTQAALYAARIGLVPLEQLGAEQPGAGTGPSRGQSGGGMRR